MLYMQHIGQHVKTFLGGLALVDDNGVVEVATLDEVCLQQRLDVTYKDECTGLCDLVGILQRVVECGKLRIDELRLKRTHGCDGELVVGQDCDARTVGLVLHLNLLADDVPVLWSILLLDAHFANLIDIHDGRSVEDGELRTIHLYHTVVDTQGVEG